MKTKPHILFITADDMNWDAVGCYGCPVPGTTPNIDALAHGGMRFTNGHVTISVCQPSRSTLLTGRYPHRSGGEGFYHLTRPEVPLLPGVLREGGYRVGILGKLEHSTPYASFAWDMQHDMDELGHGRNPGLYYQYAKTYIEKAQKAEEPFFLMLNSHDPHRPFYGNDYPEWYQADTLPAASIPSKTFQPDEITTPGFLEDLPEVRHEIAEYYNSVRRCDDTVGAVLKALRESGLEDSTIVIFLSDNGMAFPFSKTNCYLHSTKTPWIMRWPGVIQADRCDETHFISGIDLMPTLLDAAGINPPEGMDGSSFLPVLEGTAQPDRSHVYTQFHQTSAKRNYPMRCVQNRRFGYIFNPWSDGRRVFKNEAQSGRTMGAMQTAAADDPAVAERVNFFLYRVPEELYDFENDPDARHNLIDDPRYKEELNDLQRHLEDWMVKTQDPALTAFRQRASAEAQGRFMQEIARKLGGE